MANHKSAKKRIRQTAKRNAANSYYHKTARNAVRKLRSVSIKKKQQLLLPAIESMLDKLTKRNIIHKNKAANLNLSLQSMLTVFII